MKFSADPSPQLASIVKRPVDFILEKLTDSATYRALREALAAPVASEEHQTVSICGVRGSLAPFIAAGLFRDFNAPVVIFCNPDEEEVYDNDLPLLLGGHPFCNTADELSPALGRLSGSESLVVLAGFDDIGIGVCSTETSREKVFRLATGDDAGYNALMAFLKSNGFEKREFVEDEGEYSVRGSIIDVFCYGSREPLRIEFFGDMVSSLRSFDTDSQLSSASIDSIDLFGSFTNEEQGTAKQTGILDYLPASTIIIIDDATTLAGEENRLLLEAALPRFRHVLVHRIETHGIDFGAGAQEKLQGNFRILANRLEQKTAKGLKTLFACSSRREIEELAEFIAEEKASDRTSKPPEAFEWIPVTLHTGFEYNDLSVYAESDIFGKFHTRHAHRRRKIRGISLKELQRLKVGDYVVHEDYGIGIFRSLETIQVGNSE
jgi:transcription-repair coupling factor (superfamily II helicase)